MLDLTGGITILPIIKINDKYIVPKYGLDLLNFFDPKNPNLNNLNKYSLALTIADQLKKAIRLFHKYNICHLDIKSENILFDGKEIKIIDYGYTQIYKINKECMATIIGTPGLILNPNISSIDDAKSRDLSCAGITILDLIYCIISPTTRNQYSLYSFTNEYYYAYYNKLKSTNNAEFALNITIYNMKRELPIYISKIKDIAKTNMDISKMLEIAISLLNESKLIKLPNHYQIH